MKTTTYLIVEARRSIYPPVDPETGLRQVGSVHVVGQRVSRPAKLARDQVAVKVTLEVPNEIFNPITPSAVVTIPTDLALRLPVEVEAEDANAPTEVA
jgi:hypothetical protein